MRSLRGAGRDDFKKHSYIKGKHRVQLGSSLFAVELLQEGC